MISLALKGSANGLKVLSAKWHATPGIEELFQCFKGYWQITTTARAVKYIKNKQQQTNKTKKQIKT